MQNVNGSNDAGERAMLRHALATLAYRAGKSIRGAPPGFGEIRAGAETKSALETIAHIADLMEWAAVLARGRTEYHQTTPTSWDAEVSRFFKSIVELDSVLRSAAPDSLAARRIFQGPIADALTHVGQLNVLRRVAGAPIRGENYWMADIEMGRVGVEQAPPKREFD